MIWAGCPRGNALVDAGGEHERFNEALVWSQRSNESGGACAERILFRQARLGSLWLLDIPRPRFLLSWATTAAPQIAGFLE